MDYFYQGIHRLDWGFGNPNMTAALVAMLAVAVCGVALVWRKAFWFALPVAAGLLVALVHTLSRGGMVAFLAGFVVFVMAVRPRPGRVHAGVLVAVAVLVVGYAFHLGGATRYVQGINGVEDRSVSNRWLIYSSAPGMLHDAPGGWGKGKASDAYHQWYQSEGRGEDYLNLVNSHLTWMVEWPTALRLLYIAGWALVFLLAWPVSGHRWWGVVLSVWVALFVASCFSSVCHRPWIWPFPAALLLILLVHRLILMKRVPMLRALLIGPALALLVYGLLLAPALFSKDGPALRRRAGIVEVGSPEAPVKIVLCGKDRAILGTRFGHRIRSYVRKHPGTMITFVEEPRELDSSYHTTVLVGDALGKFQAAAGTNLVLLNPPAPSPDWKQYDTCAVRVLWGDLNPSPAWYAWQRKSAGSKGIVLTRLLGESLFLETWLDELVL